LLTGFLSVIWFEIAKAYRRGHAHSARNQPV
jgi:hypothetical protein